MNASLFERIGGKETIDKASNFLYVNILRDGRINKFFEDVDIEKQKRKMNAFLTYIFGGPSLYTGKNMRRAHEQAVKNGLNDEHVDAMIDCVHATFRELNVEDELINEAVKEIEKHRDDVLNR